MDENSLYCLRRTPPEEFVRSLRASLQHHNAIVVTRSRRVRSAVALAIALVAVMAAFAIPSVRAAAEAFLDLFRVVHFVAVPLTSETLQRLSDVDMDVPHLLAGQVQWSQKEAGPVAYPTPAAAGIAAGFHIQLPAWMPVGWDTETPVVELAGGKTARIVANTSQLAQILKSLEINDVTIPAGLDGQPATIRISPVVSVKWTHGTQTLELVQSPSPQVEFPAGTDLPALGEIGLRILGMSRADAYRFAQTIDWRTTLVVPVPANAGAFSQVTVQGSSGLLLELSSHENRRRRAGALLLWSNGTQVFALRGTVPSPQLVEIAQTIQ
jgi:hypothetical protein